MVKNLFYSAVFVLVLIFSGCSKSGEGNINNDIKNENLNIGEKYSEDFLDMKYVYKSVRVDKNNFSNELTNYYQNTDYSNVISRNKNFLNRKLIGDNDIKKYAIDFISNTYHYPYEAKIDSSDLYDEDFTSYYVSEYIYVEQNLALKKARDLLLTIKNKDADIYLALFLSHMATDSLYYFSDIQRYLKEWKKSGGTNINMMIGIVNEYDNINEVYSNKMNLINYIIEAPEDLRAEQLIADAYNKKFLKYISKNTGYLDIYNENNYNISSIIYEGTAHMAYIEVIKDIVNTNIMNQYIRTYAQGALKRDKLDSSLDYYQNFYNTVNLYQKEKYDEYSDLYFLEFNKNTFIYAIYEDKLKEVYCFNPKYIGNTRYASYETEDTFNFRLGDDSKLTSADTASIKTNDLKNFVTNSRFVVEGKFNRDEYAEYLNEIIYFPLYYPNFFLCDINNDGKEEIMLTGTYDHSGGRGGTASYTLVLKDNLELDLESVLGKSLNGSSRQGLNTLQKLYKENGKNKILLIDMDANAAQDIFSENGVVNVDEFAYKTYSFKPKLLWKDNMLDETLKSDASFNIFKAENDSARAIISDKTLRIADKLINDAYHKKLEKSDRKEKDELIEKRVSYIKSVEDKHGDVMQIEKEMLDVLGIDN